MPDAPEKEEIDRSTLPENFSEWTPNELGEHCCKYGLKDYQELIIKHKITGELAPLLTDEDLKDMGVNIIGDRLVFRKMIKELGAKQRMKKRTDVIWEGKDPLYYNCCDQACDTCCFICPPEPSTYTLYSNKLKIKTVDSGKVCGTRCCTACCKNYSINNIDLSQVDDTDVNGLELPCIAALMLADRREQVVIQYGGNEATMTVIEGDGEKATNAIMQLVEENKLMLRGIE